MKRMIISCIFLILLSRSFSQSCKEKDGEYTGECRVLDTIGHYLPCAGAGYKLVFEDLFDENYLDFSKWELPYEGVPARKDFDGSKQWLANTGNMPAIPYTNNIEVSNGTLKIIAKRENSPIIGTFYSNYNPVVLKTDTFDYSAARILSKNKFRYGLYEMRCRLPEGKGFGMAFWTFSSPWSEIDFFEIFGININKYTCNIHTDLDGDQEDDSYLFEKNDAADFTEWHVIRCYYSYYKIVWEIDGEIIRELYHFTDHNGNGIDCGVNYSGNCNRLVMYPPIPCKS